jgi:hypothetical protein
MPFNAPTFQIEPYRTVAHCSLCLLYSVAASVAATERRRTGRQRGIAVRLAVLKCNFCGSLRWSQKRIVIASAKTSWAQPESSAANCTAALQNSKCALFWLVTTTMFHFCLRLKLGGTTCLFTFLLFTFQSVQFSIFSAPRRAFSFLCSL